MADGIDMSLDDLIKRSSAASRSRHHGPGPRRRFTDRKPNRTRPYSIPPARQVRQQNTVSEMVLRDAGAASNDKDTKLYISNLDSDVSNEDIKLLFSEVGEVKRYGIHYDKSGRSKGSAEVTFARKSDAIAAIRRYNNMILDGKRLRIEIVGRLVTRALVPRGQTSRRPNDDALASEQGSVGGSRSHEDFERYHHIHRPHRDLGHDFERDHHIHRPHRDLGHDFERDHHIHRPHRDLGHDFERDDHIHRPHRDLGHDFERDDHIHRPHRDLDHDFERNDRIPGGHTGKLTVKDLDDDLERYHLEAKQIDTKEEGEISP